MPRGRPRKPRQRKIIQHTFRKDRNPGQEPAPPPVAAAPKPPRELNRWARRLWKDLAPELQRQRLLTSLDLATLELLCASYGFYHECRDAIHHPRGRGRSQSLKQYMRGGNSQTLPEVANMRVAWHIFNAYASQFGLSPASRNRIDVPKPKDGRSAMEKLIHGA